MRVCDLAAELEQVTRDADGPIDPAEVVDCVYEACDVDCRTADRRVTAVGLFRVEKSLSFWLLLQQESTCQHEVGVRIAIERLRDKLMIIIWRKRAVVPPLEPVNRLSDIFASEAL